MRICLFVLLAGLCSVRALARPLPCLPLAAHGPAGLIRAAQWLKIRSTVPRTDSRPVTVTLNLNTPTISFLVNSANAYNTGVTLANQNTLSVADNVGSGNYTLTVRASSANLTSGANTIPVSQVTIQLVNIGGLAYGGPVITLGTTAQTLTNYPYSGAAFTGQQLLLTYKLLGGTALLKPAGTYGTTLTYTVTGP